MRIAEEAIRLISRYRFEQLTLKQVAIVANVNGSIILRQFGNLHALVAHGILTSFDALNNSISSFRDTYDKRSIKLEDFWKPLVTFDLKPVGMAGIVCRYFKSPAPYEEIDVKNSLMASLNPAFDVIVHLLKDSNSQIRFIAFIHLYQIAFSFSKTVENLKERNLNGTMVDHLY